MSAGSHRTLHRLGFLLIVVAVLMTAGVVRAEKIATPTMFVKLDATITPKALPRSRSKPVVITIEASLKKRKKESIARLTRVQLSLNKAAVLAGSGARTCRYADIAAATSSVARENCPGALVGHGYVEANVRYPGQRRSNFKGHLQLFNGLIRKHHPAILLHVFGPEPRTASVLPFVITRSSGLFGTVMTAQVHISKWVYIRHFVLTFGQRSQGDSQGTRYLAASCPVPRGFTAGIAPFARVKFGFDNGVETDQVLVRSCRVEQ